ncbi:hypothetical protein BV20DRAFT_966659 [Pilatotrama ljubarskyi]|nr:hypothetical protein BV20DRAFT_966659 [Pilatotrama ljubarskyi]
MRFAAFEEFQSHIHGRYEDWEPSDLDSSADDESPYEQDLMQVEPGDGRLLMVKIPKHLMERWSAVEEENVLLATIRYYDSPSGAASSSASSSSHHAAAKPRIVLTLPPEPDDDRLGPDEYEMDVSAADAAAPYNEYLVAQLDSYNAESDVSRASSAHPKSSGKVRAGKEKQEGRRRRHVALAGTITHHCSLRSVLSDRLRQRVKARSMEANTPKRQIIFFGDRYGLAQNRPTGMGKSTAGTSGKINAPVRSELFLQAVKTYSNAKVPMDRMTRVPRGQLLDMLFQLFEQRQQWSFKQLRERTQQPEAYLKEILAEIAFLHRTGEHRGTWELSASYSGTLTNGSGNSPSAVAGPSGHSEVTGGEEDYEEDDSELEEVF